VGEALADDVRTATPPRGTVDGVVTSPPVDDTRVDSPPRAAESVETSARDVRVTTFPMIIDVDPIRTVHCGAEDHVGDQPRIDLALGGPETSGAQVPPSSFSCPWLPRRSINWNHTPWQEDWFEGNEDMQAVRTSIITIDNALTVSVLRRVVVA
jgi:hypothetical protein